MTTSDVERLRRITTLPQLIAYLRDELNWPIDQDAVEDDLTFDWAPEDLGLNAETAVRIKEIKQLRPLQTGQTWGIFFVNFEKKRLPVVVLRRLLNGLVVRKRVSAAKSKQAAWRTRDLLFISSYGQEGKREISFAHFCEDSASSGDLPTLRVLGWDDDDTSLKLDYVVHQLKGKLSWPEDADDAEAWRGQWAEAFVLRPREVTTTARDLADRLADLAKRIRRRANLVMKVESERGPLRRLHKAFRETLIHDLSEDDFADMYAQTITYGLLTARVSRPAGLVSQSVADMVPITNPFLRDLLSTFLTVGGRKGKIDFDEVGINDVVRTLRDANMEAVLRDFGDRKPEEDPVIFFYEDFLKAYDPVKKASRGVFYTPKPVVSYIVRSVNELLRAEFGLEDGLADTTTWGEMVQRHPHLSIPTITVFNKQTSREEEREIDPTAPFVQVLDPATGTGTFLVEAIDVIHHTLTTKWTQKGLTETQQLAAWNDYVPRHLLPRLHGYELMMAPYAIAHMKIGLKLHETGYRFGSDERARVYLTNALEPASLVADDMAAGLLEALGHEAQAVNEVKRKQRFTVVIGNPPYAGQSSNKGGWIGALVREYYLVDGRPMGESNPKWLLDDYVKFMRIAQYEISRSGCGIVGVITNHSYLDNPTFRGFRRALQQEIGSVCVLDLHGNAKRREVQEDGSPDANVFDIQQGVALSLMWRWKDAVRAQYRHGDLRGTRSQKYEYLVSHGYASTEWTPIEPAAPFYVFVPQDVQVQDEYQQFEKITDIMPQHSNGIVTGRDHLCVHWSEELAWNTVRDFVSLRAETARAKYELGEDSRDWQIRLAQQDLKRDGPQKNSVVQVLYRPFDVRWTYYTGRSRGFLCMPRPETMKNMLGEDNRALITSRMTKGETFQHVQVTRFMSEAIVMSPKTSNNGFLFPLYLRDANDEESGTFGLSTTGPRANLAQRAGAMLAALAGPRGNAKGAKAGPDDLFDYIVAVLHAPGYRRRYAEFLKMDFPRLPLTASAELFWALARLGGEVASVHLLEARNLEKTTKSFTGPLKSEVEKVSYDRDTVWIDKAQTRGFRGVTEDVWGFHIGGYQVCEKWLKDRKGRKLLKADIEQYEKIVIALNETMRLMKEIDEVIEQYGGWPGAFQTSGSKPDRAMKAAEQRSKYRT